jgi:protein-S-isoprenylcysteine O-methyltransferase Ste14
MNVMGIALVFTGYFSLALELLLIPVPSQVSAVQLVKQENTFKTRTRALWSLRWFLPVMINIATFAVPPIVAGISLTNGGGRPLIDNIGLTLSAAILIVLGRVVTIWAALAMRAGEQLSLLEGTLSTAFHQAGPFRWSRNPGLLGMYLFAVGLILLIPNVGLALGFGFYGWHMHQRVLMEERGLQARFGTTYQKYCGNTRRYV